MKQITKSFLLFLFFLPAFLHAQEAPQRFKTLAEKKVWMKNHSQLNNTGTPDPQKDRQEVKKQDEDKGQQLVNEPGFPKYYDTGNKEKDDADYKAAKDKWIQEHPDRYKEMTSQPK